MLSSRSGGAIDVALVSEHASPLALLGEVDAGGQNVHVAELAAGLSRLGHRVVVYTRRDRAGIPDRVTTATGYDVVHLAAGPPRSLPKDELWPHMPEFARGLSRHFGTDRPDVAHAHFWMSGWATQRAAWEHDVNFQLTFHALGVVKRRHQGAADSSPADRLQVEQRLATTADGVIATCRDEVAELVALGGDPDRISTVPCGVDLELFTPAQARVDRWSSGAPFRLVSVGRLVPRKGFEMIIAALASLPETELVIAGGPETMRLAADPEASRLRRLAAEFGVADRVRLLGAVPRQQLPALLRSADAVVCTPWYEPFGIVPLEAMACGVPVIASAVGGLLDTVVDGGTGLHVPPRDLQALVRAVRTLHDPQLRCALGKAAVQRVREHYSWDRVAARTAAIYCAARSERANRPETRSTESRPRVASR